MRWAEGSVVEYGASRALWELIKRLDLVEVLGPARRSAAVPRRSDTSPIDRDSDGDGVRAAERTQRAGESPAWAMALIAL